MNWNESQNQAIEERGKNILVSAAAGSGKTAVLVERIRKLVVEEQVPVDRFLIVTFTNAAASEMKERLSKSLNAEAETADEERIKYIRRQLNLIGSANISTFHGFALEVLRRYFYLTDIEPGFKVCDEEQAAIMRIQAIDNIFEKHFDEGDKDFISFISRYGSDRHERKAKEIVMELHRMVMSIPKPFEWLSEKTASLNMPFEEFIESDYVKYICEDTVSALDTYIKGIKLMAESMDDGGVPALALKFYDQSEALSEVDFAALSYAELAEQVKGISMPRMVPVKAEKPALAEIKEDLENLKKKAEKDFKEVKDKYFKHPLEDYHQDICEVYPQAVFLEKLVREFHGEFRRLKAEKNVIDFNDIEHYALDIFEKEPAAAEEYRKKFEYIFIDEYQDSNDVQETLIKYIARDNNLFMVGDVKQSIYKFRLAEPEIFMNKYKAYSADEDEKSIKIDFNENYRSKAGVINAVNTIFLGRMEGYDDEGRLNKGMAYEGNLEYDSEVIVNDILIEEGVEIDEEIRNLKKEEIEARAAVNIIREWLGKEIYDAKKDCIRNIQYRDIVILMRSTKGSASAYQSVLEEAGIPVFVEDGEGYFDTIEISMIENMLRVIDNSRQDVPLLSVLYSPVMNFSLEELMDIRLGTSEKEFYKAFDAYSAEGEDEVLRNKCLEAKKRIESWKMKARSVDISELVWSLMWDTGYYTYAGALPGGVQRQANLRALADKALNLSKQGVNDLYGLLMYIDALRGKNISIGQVKIASEEDNVVRIMTVHKSKGLEFPVVIAAGSGKNFNTKSKVSGLSALKKAGYCMDNVNPEKHWYRKTIIQSLIERMAKKESLEEEKRILYVEYTRAMDKLIILASVKDYESKQTQFEADLASQAGSALEYVAPAGLKTTVYYMGDVSLDHAEESAAKDAVKDILKNDECRDEEVERRLSFKYPFADNTQMKYKYSVTELNHGSEPAELMFRVPSFAASEHEFTAAEKGTITHKAMEYIDFGSKDIDAEIEILVQKNIFSESEAEVINRVGIAAFIDSEIGKRAAKAEVLKKEQLFTMMTEKDGASVMVQGIIDCFFEEDGEVVLIDYKNSNVRSDEILTERYIEQINLYAKAIEESTGKKVKERYLYLMKDCRFLGI